MVPGVSVAARRSGCRVETSQYGVGSCGSVSSILTTGRPSRAAPGRRGRPGADRAPGGPPRRRIRAPARAAPGGMCARPGPQLAVGHQDAGRRLHQPGHAQDEHHGCRRQGDRRPDRPQRQRHADACAAARSARSPPTATAARCRQAGARPPGPTAWSWRVVSQRVMRDVVTRPGCHAGQGWPATEHRPTRVLAREPSRPGGPGAAAAARPRSARAGLRPPRRRRGRPGGPCRRPAAARRARDRRYGDGHRPARGVRGLRAPSLGPCGASRRDDRQRARARSTPGTAARSG